MTEQARDLLEKNVTLTNGLKIDYYEWPGAPGRRPWFASTTPRCVKTSAP